MSSIFDLNQDVKGLEPVNDGMSRLWYEQVSATRNIQDTAFSNGNIHFKWQCSGTRWWMPSQSYLRLDVEILNSGDNQPVVADDIALNMGLCANLFSQAELRLNGKTVSRIGDNLAQVDALENRLTQSRTWLKNIGQDLNQWSKSQNERKNAISSNGVVFDEKSVAPEIVIEGHTELGFDGTLETDVANTGIITLTNLNNVNLQTTFATGGSLVFTDGNGVQIRTITAVSNANSTITVDNVPALATKASAVDSLSFIEGTVDTASIPSARANRIQVLWTPCLSLFGYDGALPTGEYELILTPAVAQNLPLLAVESPSGVSDAKFKVDNGYFMVNMMESSRVENLSYVIGLDVIDAQVRKVQSNNNNQLDFTVNPNTYALTVAFQDNRVGSNTRYSASKFKFGDTANTQTSEELKLNRLFIQYAGQQIPQPDASPEFDANTDRTVQRYLETQLYARNASNEGSPESLQDFHDRGSYYHFMIARDGRDMSTQALVNSSFRGNNNDVVAQCNAVLFQHYKQALFVDIKDGRVYDVRLQDY